MAANVRQSNIISGSGVATLSRALPAPTLAGNRIMVLVCENESGTLAPVASVPAAMTEVAPPSPSIRENPVGTPQIRVRAYQRKNASASVNGSTSETFTVTLSRACDWTLIVLELDQVAATADVTCYQSNNGAAQTLSTGTTPVSGSTDSLFLAVFGVANIDALTVTAGSTTAGFSMLTTSTSGGTAAATKIRAGVAVKHSTVSEAGQCSVDVAGGFNHNYAALILNIPGAAGGGGGGGGSLVPLGMTCRGYSQVSPGGGPGDFTAFPWIRLWSPWFDWHQLNPSRGTYVWTVLDQWLDVAEALGKTLFPRFVVGHGPDWIFTDPTNPVSSIQLRVNAASPFQRAAVPWDADLRVLWRLFLQALKTHLDTNAAGGTPRRNLVSLTPISMPFYPGTEMWTVDEGDDNTKGSGFPGTGNMAAWMNLCTSQGAAGNFAACDTYRKTQLGQAVDNALDDHDTYLHTIRPILGCGALFTDGQAKARAIPAARAATMPTLAGMETNGRPNGGDVDTNPSVAGVQAQITGLWKEWCGGCHNVATAFIAAGLDWAMQTADVSIFNRFVAGGATPQKAFQYMARDLVGYMDPADVHYANRYDYPLILLEPNPALLLANAAYAEATVQPQIMAQAGGAPPPPPANAGAPSITLVSST